jgi:hypothetical protein
MWSVSWPGGRRWLMIDPEGGADPAALRAGQVSDDADLARAIDAMWSQALRMAKQIMDGEVPTLPGVELEEENEEEDEDEDPPKRRGWRRRS